MEARYLRVKNWARFQHYDPTKRRPPWIKFYNDLLDSGDPFMELSELEQWQLVRVWLVASRSEVLTVDENGVVVPAVVENEQSLRRSTMSLKPLPLAKFMRLGWLIPVDADELLDAVPGDSTIASTVASTMASGSLSSREKLEKRESPKALGVAPVSVTHSPTQYEGADSTPLQRLEGALELNHTDLLKVRRAAKGCSEAALVGALEACRGPGVKDRIAVALSELKKRRAA